MSSQGSRLAQIQMRYQQKQMNENAQKKSDMFDETQKLLTSSLGAGKVRAMFDERRHRITAGIDKSYLLEPIVVDTKTTVTSKRSIAPSRPARYDQKMSNYSKVIVPPLQSRLINHDINGNNHFSDDPLDRTYRGVETMPKAAVKPVGGEKPKVGITRKLTPAVTSPPPLKNVTNQKASPSRSTKSGNSTGSSNNSSRIAMSPKAITTTTSQPTRTVAVTKPRAPTIGTKSNENSTQSSFEEEEVDAPVPEGLVRCDLCKRNFAEDRIEKHRKICQMTKSKKRKVYDSTKKRVQGTEAESYLRKPISAKAVKTNKQAATSTPKPSAWRSKHEDFIKTIRAAKEMQQHLARGGKLSDLPPPPPSENPDYVTCPHCSRRFNEGVAARHIPACANMLHNKPKPKPANTGSKVTSFTKRR